MPTEKSVMATTSQSPVRGLLLQENESGLVKPLLDLEATHMFMLVLCNAGCTDLTASLRENCKGGGYNCRTLWNQYIILVQGGVYTQPIALFCIKSEK